ncbi:MAG: HIT domain-containing protein [Anaeromyxobacter sp.]|nr:HIT domain-containing protein [Anaeromyxobacter sp.]MBL0278002.1 HIT domain-containing protein [Anaeromyxobacter sp.]
MQRPLWAPWRMEFIAAEKPTGCIFCQYPAEAEAEDRRTLIVHRAPHAFTILNRYPYNSGHLMVVPRRHGAALEALPPVEWAGLMDEVRRAEAVLRAVYRPEGINVGMNLGRAGGAGIVDHLHWHLVPRWVGDNNFMPVLADIRVMVDHLETTWEKVHAGFAASPP